MNSQIECDHLHREQGGEVHHLAAKYTHLNQKGSKKILNREENNPSSHTKP